MGQEDQSAGKRIMINKVWEWFNAQVYKGSISFCDPKALRLTTQPAFICKANTPDDDTFIHEAIYEMDPDYTVVAVIKQAGNKAARNWAEEVFPDGIEEISFEGSPEDIQERLDEAILEGLAHRKALMVRESGAVVKFGYKLEDIM